MNQEVKECLNKLMNLFPKSFINQREELIVEPKNNICFKLGDITSKLEFDCKVIAWLSRPSCKSVSVYWQKKFRKGFNDYFNTSFTESEMKIIYSQLGLDGNGNLSIEFIKSNLNMEALKS